MGESNENGRSSISKSQSYEEMAEFWETHDTADYWNEFEEVDMEVEFPRRHRIVIEAETYRRIVAEASRRGVSPETLVNMWLVERLQALPAA